MPNMLPYLKSYWDILKREGINFDVLCWNRKGEDFSSTENFYIYNSPTWDEFGALKKLFEILGFNRFIIKHLKSHKYKGLFVFTIADSLFLSLYLIKHYRRKYLYDIRDYSPMLRLALFRWLNNCLLKNSALNVISSAGFLKWLPDRYEYTISHNVTLTDLVHSINGSFKRNSSDKYKILTIGRIRDELANASIIQKLGNNIVYDLNFYGDGPALSYLKNTVDSLKFTNIHFYGRYKKEDEDSIVEECDMLNVCMGNDMISNFLMSNRIYLGARLRKPLISYEGSYQADIIQKYHLGLVLSESDSLDSAIKKYWREFDEKAFMFGCKSFLESVEVDMLIFSENVSTFIRKQQ